MNVSVRFVVVSGVALVVAAVLVAGIYYLLGPAGNPPQTFSVLPPLQAAPTLAPHAEQRPAIGDSPTQRASAEFLPEGNAILAPSAVSQAKPNLPLDFPVEVLGTALPKVRPPARGQLP